jgi:ribosomal protein L37E
MYCKECGQQIADDSKFCSFCGTNQSSKLSSLKQNNTTENKSSAISTDQFDVVKQTFRLNISKKIIGYYLIWIVAHFVILLVNGDFEYDEDFWPITDTDIYYYDFSEFLIYTFVPLLFLFSFNLFKKEEKEMIMRDKLDMSFERDFGFLKWGLIAFGFYIVYWSLSEDFFYYNLDINDKGMPFAIISMLIRLIATSKVVIYAGVLNRNKTGWGFFTFFIPLLSLILISLQYKKKDKYFEALPKVEEKTFPKWKCPNCDWDGNINFECDSCGFELKDVLSK